MNPHFSGDPFFMQFKASVWSYYRSQGLTEDGEEDDEDASLLYDHRLSPSGAENSLDGGPSAPSTRRPGDLHRGNVPAARAAAAAVETTIDSSEGDLTANITAMPLPGSRRA
jgi:hypothetical protein